MRNLWPVFSVLAALWLAMLATTTQAAALSEADKALLAAADKGELAAVNKALKAKANVNAQDADGWTPLLFAATRGLDPIVGVLIKAGANPNLAAGNGGTPLIGAVISGNPAVVKQLLDARADPNAKVADGRSALDIARAKKNATVIAVLEAVTTPAPSAVAAERPKAPAGPPSQPVGDPVKIMLPDGYSLADWAILASERIDKGEAAAVTEQAHRLMQTHGPHDILVKLGVKGVDALLAQRRLDAETAAQVDTDTTAMIAAYGKWPPLLLDLAQAKHLKGDYPGAAAVYLELLQLISAEHPLRKTILTLSAKARSAAAIAPADLAFFDGDRKRLRGGKFFKDCAECPEMVAIPAGSYAMGSPAGEAGRYDNEGPVHTVNVSGFSLGRDEVTRRQYAAFVSATGHAGGGDCYVFVGGQWKKNVGGNWQSPGFAQDDRHPAACISWNDAKAYVAWLSRKTGKPYRLPSEAEWEYAARAGSAAARPWGESADAACGEANVGDQTTKSQVPGWSSDIHNCNDGHAYTAPAGSFKPNAFGLYDMIGNVWEWVEDCWNDSYSDAPADGRAWTSGNCGRRVLRGAAWDGRPQSARSASRFGIVTGDRNGLLGFRVALSAARTN